MLTYAAGKGGKKEGGVREKKGWEGWGAARREAVIGWTATMMMMMMGR
jgi:hypothetical protein